MNLDYNDISDYSKKIEKKFQSIIDNEIIDIVHGGIETGVPLIKALYTTISQTYMKFTLKFATQTTHINGREAFEEKIDFLLNHMKKYMIEYYEQEKDK